MNGRFDEAFLAVKRGEKLSRQAWAPGTYLQWQEPLDVSVDVATINQYVSGSPSVWVPALADLLAADWFIFRP